MGVVRFEMRFENLAALDRFAVPPLFTKGFGDRLKLERGGLIHAGGGISHGARNLNPNS